MEIDSCTIDPPIVRAPEAGGKGVPIALPTRRDGRPYYTARYWEAFFRKFPERLPSKGRDFDECYDNYKAFVRDEAPIINHIPRRVRSLPCNFPSKLTWRDTAM